MLTEFTAEYCKRIAFVREYNMRHRIYPLTRKESCMNLTVHTRGNVCSSI